MLLNTKNSTKSNVFNDFFTLEKSIRVLAIRYMMDEIKISLNATTSTQIRDWFKNQQCLAPNTLNIVYSNNDRSWRNAIRGAAMEKETLEAIHEYNSQFTECLLHPFWYVLNQLGTYAFNIKHPLVESYKGARTRPLKHIFREQLVVYGSHYYHIDKYQNLDALTALLIIIKNHPFEEQQYKSRCDAIHAMIISMSLKRPFQVIGKEVYELFSKMPRRSFETPKQPSPTSLREVVDQRAQLYRLRRRFFFVRHSYLPRFVLTPGFSENFEALQSIMVVIDEFSLLKSKRITKEWFGFYMLRSDLDSSRKVINEEKPNIKRIKTVISQIKKERTFFNNQSYYHRYTASL